MEPGTLQPQEEIGAQEKRKEETILIEEKKKTQLFETHHGNGRTHPGNRELVRWETKDQASSFSTARGGGGGGNDSKQKYVLEVSRRCLTYVRMLLQRTAAV